MLLSISNIAWQASDDLKVYEMMHQYGYQGLEIAPTRIFVQNPYDRLKEAKLWYEEIQNQYGFKISSMQSIWYGRSEKIFESKEARKQLLDYTKKAIDFAKVIGCHNLVFGCPKNRNIPENFDESIAVAFFKAIGDYAYANDTIIGMEANPSIYNTNYINDTKSAFQLIKQVNSQGFKLNLDLGTMIYNQEDPSELIDNVALINHVHISEPYLKPIQERLLHRQIKDILIQEQYHGYISIEMGNGLEISQIESIMQYVKNIFDE